MSTREEDLAQRVAQLQMNRNVEESRFSGLTQQSELARLMDLYPTPTASPTHTSARDIMESVQFIRQDAALTDEQRLIHLHRMLELSTLELENEVLAYQVAHRQLVGHEGNVANMVASPRPPADTLDHREERVDSGMEADRRKMKESTQRMEALFKAMKFADSQVKETQATVTSEGKQKGLSRISDEADEHDDVVQADDNGEPTHEYLAAELAKIFNSPGKHQLQEDSGGGSMKRVKE
ncbi:MAG: hypothetical protein Q9183_003098 [Haloplaca sp. 2 TL-2023]